MQAKALRPSPAPGGRPRLVLEARALCVGERRLAGWCAKSKCPNESPRGRETNKRRETDGSAPAAEGRSNKRARAMMAGPGAWRRPPTAGRRGAPTGQAQAKVLCKSGAEFNVHNNHLCLLPVGLPPCASAPWQFLCRDQNLESPARSPFLTRRAATVCRRCAWPRRSDDAALPAGGQLGSPPHLHPRHAFQRV
jgi:hypothetical protein